MAPAPWRRVVAWAAVVVVLAILLGARLPVASGSAEGGVVEAATTPAFVVHDIRNPGEPREERHQETPAKKARLTTLKVLTERTPALPLGIAFPLQASPLPPDAVSHTTLPRLAAQGALRLPDPTLSLHYGQAPPAA